MDAKEDEKDEGILEVSLSLLNGYVGVTAFIALLDFIFVIYLLGLTLKSDKRGTVKNCEKLLLFNVVVPDFLLIAYIAAFVIPATDRNKWPHNEYLTAWLGFIHILVIFHANMAMACICSIVTFSVKSPHGYEAIANWKNMWGLVFAYVSMSICFCALPVVEDKGMEYRPYWFTPTLTIFQGFGGIFAVAALLTFMLRSEVRDLTYLIKVKRELKEKKAMGKKVTLKEEDCIATFITFVSWSLGLNVLLLITIVDLEGPVLLFVMRLLLYSGPIWRVMLITQRCPHFVFQAKTEQVALEDLVMNVDVMTFTDGDMGRFQM